MDPHEQNSKMDSERHPKLSPMRAFQAFYNPPEEENTFPSLSEYHDYEPRLEFDDTEFKPDTGLAPLPPELLDLSDEMMYDRPTSDGTIEENFEEELGIAPAVYTEITDGLEQEFTELTNSRFVEVVGDDEIGRRIIVISACKLPPTRNLYPDLLLQYLMFTLDKYVEQDYSLVYFHHGLSSENKPPVSWLWKAYKAFDRKYKKNLKALYLVHPTNMIRFVWQMLRPAISVKFGKKMMYVNYLYELGQHLELDKLCIPEQVLEYDNVLLTKNPKAAEMARTSKAQSSTADESSTSKKKEPLPTQQFGVSLKFIKDNNSAADFRPPNGVAEFDHPDIPPIVRQCVEFLSQPDALETEGIFRRSANVAVIRELQQACNRGEAIDFNNDPHIAAVLLKNFFRDLEEPLLTFDLYDEIMEFQTWPPKERPRRVKILILERLPLINYNILKYLIRFLWKVKERCCLNKMTSFNLAVVIGPNIVWPPKHQITLEAIGPITAFTDFVINNQGSIFIM